MPDEDISPIAKEEMRRAWKTKAQLASLNGMKPEERLDALGVAPAAAGPGALRAGAGGSGGGAVCTVCARPGGAGAGGAAAAVDADDADAEPAGKMR